MKKMNRMLALVLCAAMLLSMVGCTQDPVQTTPPTTQAPTTVHAKDLRAGAALIIAGLAAEGTTYVKNIHYVERGYERIIEKLTQLGAQIKRIED